MNRREALRRTALVMGTAVSASTIAGIMQGCAAKPELAWTPSFFTEDQAQLVSAMAETIIPKTDTPGAKEAGVPQFIEEMIGIVENPENRELFLNGLNAFNEQCASEHGDSFVSLAPEAQTACLEKYNTDMQQMLQSGVRKAPLPDQAFFRKMKELTVVGFFTSQPGATQVLQYSPIPVEYNGCISLEEAGGKTWAT